MIKKNFKEIENAEYGVDSRYSLITEQQNDGKALMEARLERMKNVSPEQIFNAKLIQLKLKMEDYIQEPVYKNHYFFTEFLTTYIDIVDNKRADFANDIDITPIRLSQVLNNHREPKDEFIHRLMVHSEKIYQNVCEFQKMIWFQVYYHEKICATMSKQNEWRPKAEKHVNVKKLVSI